MKIGVCLSVSPATMRTFRMHLAILDHPLREVRNVIPDVEIAHVGRHPAPFLHVGEQPLRRGAFLLILGEKGQKFLAEQLELRMGRVQAAQVGAGLCGTCDAIENRSWG